VADFLDISQLSLNKTGEELCGDQVKILRTDNKTRVVLSDGLGSGVKANILATLTSQIIITMLKENVPLEDVIGTVIGTLPVCQMRNIAYATFTIIEVDHSNYHFRVINFDNPPFFYLKGNRVVKLEKRTEHILDKEITFCEGNLERGDFVAAASDGILYAGLGVTFNFGWGWDNIADHMATVLSGRVLTAQTVVDSVVSKTQALYAGAPGDDATLVGLYLRQRKAAMVLTGPPLNREDDPTCARRLVEYEGRRIICGGTTANIVGRFLGKPVETLIDTMREEIPPIGRLGGVHLVTEGILTMSRAIEYIRTSDGDDAKLPRDGNGAVLLASELLFADAIHFLVGQQVNPFYQNPLLPTHISIRKNLVEQMAALLRELNKDVTVEYC